MVIVFRKFQSTNQSDICGLLAKCTTLKVGLSCECKMNIMSLEMILDYDCNEAIGSQEYDGKPLGLEVTGVDKDPIDLIG